MKKLLFVPLLFTGSLVTAFADDPAPGPLTLWYDKPAADAMNEALPVGNGRIGGLDFGGAEHERFVLNEDSFWSGDSKSNYGLDSYGAYQVMGNLYLDLGTSSLPVVSCPSGQQSQPNQGVDSSVDGDLNTKWCVPFHGPVVWQASLDPKAGPVTSYTLVSGDDSPGRDPKSWEFSGSQDGDNWTTLDRQVGQGPFPGRKQAKTFTFTNLTAYKFYRLSFSDNNGDALFQLSEIIVPGQSSMPEAKTGNYRHELNLSTAISTTRFSVDGVPQMREIFSSRPDNVMVVHWSSPSPRALTGTIKLQGSHNETVKADGNSISFSGKLGNGEQYETIAHVLNNGGTLTTLGTGIQVKAADEVVILIATATDYVLDDTKHFQSGIQPHDALVATLAAAEKKNYAQLRADHIKSHQAFFNRVSLDLGKSTPEQIALPINKRKVLAADTFDPELEALFFQYGRYLLIGSSQPGSLPPIFKEFGMTATIPPGVAITTRTSICR